MDVKVHGKFEIRPVTDLTPHPRNPRTHDPEQVAEIAASIAAVGFGDPIMVDERLVILAGHGRALAAKMLGLVAVPTVMMEGLTDEQKLAYVIADNQIPMNADWDEGLLASNVAWLSMQNYNLDTLGFGPADLAKLLETPQAGADSPAEDVPDPPERPVSRHGDLWILGNHRVLCGDSLERDQVDRLLEGAKARMAFTDPPWNVAIGLDSNPRHRQRKGLQNDNVAQPAFDRFMLAAAASLAASVTGDVYVVMGSEQWPLVDTALRAAGFHWSASVMWVKDTFVLGRSKYHRRYEPIWYGWPAKATSSFQGRRDLDDVWEFPRPRASAEHPTMKPVALMQRAIENSCATRDVVLDLFGGSGSTLIACEQTRRKCAMVELDPRFVDVIVSRWQDFVEKPAMLEGGGTFAEVAQERAS